jgi:hypothetical protein
MTGRTLTGTSAALQAQADAVDRDVQCLFEGFVPNMGPAAHARLLGRIRARQAEWRAINARLREADVEQRYRDARLADRLERRR